MTLINRPLFLHPRVMWRLGRPVLFAAEPRPGADVLETDAAALFAALKPLIEVLNLAGFEVVGAAWSPDGDEAAPVTYVNFITLAARADYSTWSEVVGVDIPQGADAALGLQVEPRIASGYNPPLADPAELTYAINLTVPDGAWSASREPLSVVTPGWIVHVPDHAVGTLGAAVDALGPSRTGRSKRWIARGDLGSLVAALALQVYEGWDNSGAFVSGHGPPRPTARRPAPSARYRARSRSRWPRSPPGSRHWR